MRASLRLYLFAPCVGVRVYGCVCGRVESTSTRNCIHTRVQIRAGICGEKIYPGGGTCSPDQQNHNQTETATAFVANKNKPEFTIVSIRFPSNLNSGNIAIKS